MSNQTAFERFTADLASGANANLRDIADLEKYAGDLHNHYPQKIDGLNAELKSVKTRLDAARVALDSRTESIVQAVVMAKTPEGKPLFSNESLRGIEVKKRIAADSQCAVELAEIEHLEESHNLNVILLQRAQNDYSAWKHMLASELASRA